MLPTTNLPIISNYISNTYVLITFYLNNFLFTILWEPKTTGVNLPIIVSATQQFVSSVKLYLLIFFPVIKKSPRRLFH